MSIRSEIPDDRSRPPATRARASSAPPRIHLVLGPVGSGKSTYAARLAIREGALRLTLDDWMATLFRPDRPAADVVAWYVERADRCVDQIWRVAQDLLLVGGCVVLELGLVRRDQRGAFFARLDEEALPFTIHLLDAPREVRRERVARRNRERGPSFAMEVPPALFELASDLWQPLSDDEWCGRDLREVSS